MKKLFALLLAVLVLTGCADTYDGPTETRSLLSRSEVLIHSDGEVLEHTVTEYSYDIYGNQVQTVSFRMEDSDVPSDPHSKTTLRYDKSGNLIRQTEYNVTGWFPKKVSDSRYTYDALGRMTGSVHNGTETVTIVYDDEARTRTTSTDSGSVVVEYLDEQGWVRRVESTFADGKTLTEEFTRREDGQWTVSRTPEAVNERTFDEQGRPVLWTKTENGTTTTVFRWEYGDLYEILYHESGKNVTVFHPDGTVMYRYTANHSGELLSTTYYYYTEIQVSAKEGTP